MLLVAGVAPPFGRSACGRDRPRTTIMISDFSMWLGGKDASICVGKSREWIEIKALEWPLDNKPVEGRIRFQWLRDKPSDLGVRRYYRPDLDAIQRWSTFVTQGRPVGFKQVEPCDPFMNTNNVVWLGAKDAGAYVGRSPDWVEDRALEWPLDEKPIQGRIRFQWLRDRPNDRGTRRFYRPDIDRFLYKR